MSGLRRLMIGNRCKLEYSDTSLWDFSDTLLEDTIVFESC